MLPQRCIACDAAASSEDILNLKDPCCEIVVRSPAPAAATAFHQLSLVYAACVGLASTSLLQSCFRLPLKCKIRWLIAVSSRSVNMTVEKGQMLSGKHKGVLNYSMLDRLQIQD